MPNINDIPSGVPLAPKKFIIPAAVTTLTLTTEHAGGIVMIASTGGLAITPPPATGTLNIYQVMCIAAISGGSATIDPKAGAASDVFGGIAFGGTTGAVAGSWVSGATTNFITWNATTSGGLMGTYLWMIDVATNKWVGWCSLVSSGTAISPFSNH